MQGGNPKSDQPGQVTGLTPVRVDDVPLDGQPQDPAAADANDDFAWDLDVVTNLAALYITYIASTWALFALSLSLTYIEDVFPGRNNQASWISAIIGLDQCVLGLFIGELSDIFGRRYFIICGNIFLVVGSLISSRGNSVAMIIGGQVLTGIGSSCGWLTTPLIAEVVPKSSRSVAVALVTGLVGLVSSIGAIGIGAFQKYNVGGENQGWRPGAYITAGLGFLALTLTFVFYHPGPRQNPEGLSIVQRLKIIDWFGILVGGAGLTLVLMGLEFGGNPYSWHSALVVSLLVVGCLCLVVFAIWEAKFASFGLFPGPVFRHRNYSIVLATQFIEGMAVNTGVTFLIEMQLDISTSDAVLAQVHNIPYGTSSLIGAAIAAIVIYKTRETKWLIIAGLSSTMLGAGIMSLFKPDSSYAVWFFPSIFLGMGIAAMGVGIVIVASVVTPNQLIATALSIVSSVRGLGGAVGIVIFSRVLSNKATKYLPSAIATAALAAGLPESSLDEFIEAVLSGDDAAIEKVPGVTLAVIDSIQGGERLGYAQSFSWIWYAMMPFIGVTIISALFLKKTKAMTTGEIASRVQSRFRQTHESPDTKTPDAETPDHEPKQVESEHVEVA